MDRDDSLAVAESLTGGLLGATLTEVAGVSAVFRGGITAYATDLKEALLGIDPDLLVRHGPVSAEVAAAMARGVRDRLGASYGIATTGVAGPQAQAGQPVGTVFLAAVGPAEERVEGLFFAGDRSAIRAQAVESAIRLAVEMVVRAEPPGSSAR